MCLELFKRKANRVNHYTIIELLCFNASLKWLRSCLLICSWRQNVFLQLKFLHIFQPVLNGLVSHFPLKCQTNSWFAADQLSPRGFYIRWSRVFVLLCADWVGTCALVAQVIWKSASPNFSSNGYLSSDCDC